MGKFSKWTLTRHSIPAISAIRKISLWSAIMATSGEMVIGVADMFAANPSTVESIDRALSDAGLRRKSGRGRSAAQMAGMDVINLSLAMILGASMKDAAEKVAQVSRMPLQKATVQWRPDLEMPLSSLAEQVEQYQEHPAQQADLHMFPAGAALVKAQSMGEGLAALIDAMAADEFRDLTDMALNLQMSSIGPSALLAYATRQGVLRMHYETIGTEAERPVFERRLKFDETLLRRLAEVIRPH